MLKIHQLFLRTFVLIFVGILLTLTIVTYFWSKNIYLDQIEKNLSQNIDSLAISLTSFSNIDYVIKTFKAKTAMGTFYENTYHFLFIIENGKVKRMKEYMDTFSAKRLLESIPQQ